MCLPLWRIFEHTIEDSATNDESLSHSITVDGFVFANSGIRGNSESVKEESKSDESSECFVSDSFDLRDPSHPVTCRAIPRYLSF